MFSHAVTIEQCRTFKEIELMEATYWAESVKAVCKMEGIEMADGEVYLKAQLMGTQSERLLKVASGLPGRRVLLHLCPYSCKGAPHREDTIHVSKFREVTGERDAWMSNLVAGPEEGEDDLARLRSDQQLREAKAGQREPSEKGRRRSRSRRRRSRSRRRKGAQLKVEQQKALAALYKDTGVDPDPAVRRRFRRKAAKLARKKKAVISSSSGSSSSTGEDGELATDDPNLFGGSSRSQVIGKRLPGTLAAAALDEASETLITQEGGVWDLQTGPLPPLFMRYFRQQLSAKMTPAMAREAQSLAYLLDLLVRGRPAEALDLGAQRLKALEAQAGGAHYSVAQQVELLPKDTASMSSTLEMQEAARRAREEGRVRMDTSRPYGSKNSLGPSKDDSGKGYTKKGGKGKTGKGDGKKGNHEKGDDKRTKGG